MKLSSSMTWSVSRDEKTERGRRLSLPFLYYFLIEVREWVEARMEAAYFPTGDKSREALWV